MIFTPPFRIDPQHSWRIIDANGVCVCSLISAPFSSTFQEAAAEVCDLLNAGAKDRQTYPFEIESDDSRWMYRSNTDGDFTQKDGTFIAAAGPSCDVILQGGPFLYAGPLRRSAVPYMTCTQPPDSQGECLP